MSFSLANLDLRYEPFPIGVARPIMDEAAYERYLDRYPPIELFEYIPKVGNKYCLSEKYNPDKYHEWIKDHECWREFHRWVKSPTSCSWCSTSWPAARSTSASSDARPPSSCSAACAALLAGRWWQGEDRLSARFEFSMLPADGGSVTPHTDNPDKIITMVVSMARPGEWDPAFGGGTEVNRHRSPERSFNRINGKAEFEDMERWASTSSSPTSASCSSRPSIPGIACGRCRARARRRCGAA